MILGMLGFPARCRLSDEESGGRFLHVSDVFGPTRPAPAATTSSLKGRFLFRGGGVGVGGLWGFNWGLSSLPVVLQTVVFMCEVTPAHRHTADPPATPAR